MPDVKPGPRLPQVDGVLVGTQDRNQQRCCRLLVEMPSSRPSKLPKYWSHPGITKIWKKRLVYIGHPEYRDVVNKVERICETENLNEEVRDLYRCENDKAWYMYDNQFEARCPYPDMLYWTRSFILPTCGSGFCDTSHTGTGATRSTNKIRLWC